MNTTWRFITTSVVFGYFAACAPVHFEKAPEPPCGGEGVACVTKCEGPSCINSYSTVRTVGDAMVDILFVNDNSGSMSTEQSKMGSRFQTFIDSLGQMDFRIAMVTTDISNKYVPEREDPSYGSNRPGPYNGNGSLQDGNLIEFRSGLTYLSRDTSGKESLFQSAIQRQETQRCENSNYRECPSNDERGIFAANLVLDRNASWMRPMAHLAVVVLSDEDERGMSDTRSNKGQGILMPLREYDKPSTLVSKFKQKFPGKTLSFHSIIVKPGDSACLQEQSSQGNAFIRGVEGYSYAEASRLTGGKVGSICANDYGAILTDIGYHIQDQVTSIPFSCRPDNDDYRVKFDPQPRNNIQVTADFEKLELRIEDPLPPLTKVTLEYDCSKN